MCVCVCLCISREAQRSKILSGACLGHFFPQSACSTGRSGVGGRDSWLSLCVCVRACICVCACVHVGRGTPPVNFTLFWLPWHNLPEYSDPAPFSVTHTHTHPPSAFYPLQRFRTSTRASFSLNVAYLPFHQCPHSSFSSKDSHPSLSFPSPMFFTLIEAFLRIKTLPVPQNHHASMLFLCCLLWMRSGEPLRSILQRLNGNVAGLAEWSTCFGTRTRVHPHLPVYYTGLLTVYDKTLWLSFTPFVHD